MSNFRKRAISDLIKNEALDYAKYTIACRAIPNVMDGFKPVHRYFMYSAIKGGTGFQKVASVGGAVSGFGYHHGEGAAEDAGALMAAAFCNNLPLFDRDGFFGSRLVQRPGDARYIKCRVANLFREIYLDGDILPAHEDPEHIPPEHYLPVIPMVLVNGFFGIAKAYATNIPPHCPLSVTKCCLAYLKGKPFSLDLKYPDFNGTVENGVIVGCYEQPSKTKIIITEIPPRFDREKYLAVLDKLQEKGVIGSYKDASKKTFRYEVTLKREQSDKMTREKILDLFKLTENVNPNINAIHGMKLMHFDTAEDLLVEFMRNRSGFYQMRIDKRVEEFTEAHRKAVAKISFITHMIEHPEALKGLKRSEAVLYAEGLENCDGYGDMLVSMNIYHLTVDELEKLELEKCQISEKLDYWENTTASEEHQQDLERLIKKLK